MIRFLTAKAMDLAHRNARNSGSVSAPAEAYGLGRNVQEVDKISSHKEQGRFVYGVQIATF